MQDILLDELVPTESLYLTKEDVGEQGVNLTIAGFKIESVGHGNQADQLCVMGFVEGVKPMVVKKTNMNRLKTIFNAESTAQVRGQMVNVFNDVMVEYGGKLTGGIRIREAQTQPAPSAAPIGNEPGEMLY